jgi:hypothetical protein
VLWLVNAAVGDVPIAIVACAGLLVGVWAMVRGRGADAQAVVAPAAAAPPASAPPAPAPLDDPAAAPAAPDPPAATTFRQGAIRLGGDAAPAPEVAAQPEPAAAAPEPDAQTPPPQAAAAPEPDAPTPPPQPAAPPLPQAPPTDFRQGRIRVGGLERGKPRD